MTAKGKTRVMLLTLGATLFLGSTTLAQSPAYPELFRDPPRASDVTTADLPNLGRLVVLTATSMFVHAREELYDSPGGRRLLDQVGDLWIAADAFTAAVSFESLETPRIQAGLLSLPDLL